MVDCCWNRWWKLPAPFRLKRDAILEFNMSFPRMPFSASSFSFVSFSPTRQPFSAGDHTSGHSLVAGSRSRYERSGSGMVQVRVSFQAFQLLGPQGWMTLPCCRISCPDRIRHAAVFLLFLLFLKMLLLVLLKLFHAKTSSCPSKSVFSSVDLRSRKRPAWCSAQGSACERADWRGQCRLVVGRLLPLRGQCRLVGAIWNETQSVKLW